MIAASCHILLSKQDFISWILHQGTGVDFIRVGRFENPKQQSR